MAFFIISDLTLININSYTRIMSKSTSKTLLWKVYKDDPTVCHYIMGTIHTATNEAMAFRELAEACINRVSIYAGEMNLDTVDRTTLTSFLMLPDDQKLTDFFPPKKYQKFKNLILKTYHLDLDELIRFTPFYISNLLAEQSLEQTASLALDYALWRYASLEGKEMHGLESFQEQCAIMKQIPLKYQLKSFKDSLRNISQNQKKINSLNKIYAQGELEKLYKSSKKSMGGIRSLMIYDRNKNMLNRIHELFIQKSCFIAVGAAHLAGDKGILAGLKRADYKIKMIKERSDL